MLSVINARVESILAAHAIDDSRLFVLVADAVRRPAMMLKVSRHARITNALFSASMLRFTV